MTISGKRLEMLQAIVGGDDKEFHKTTCSANEMNRLAEWQGGMRLVGCNAFNTRDFTITDAGREELRQFELGRLGKSAMRQLGKIKAGRKILCRTVRPEAAGYEYFTEPDHAPFPELSAGYLIEKGYVTPQEDGLFPGMSQTFVVAANG